MAVTVTMPQLGETVTEGTILSWAKQPGDMVEEDEVLLEISTDKVDTEVPSPAAGVLQEILVAEGETVSVGTPLAVLAEQGESAAATAPPVVEPEPISAPEPVVTLEAATPPPAPEPISAPEPVVSFEAATPPPAPEPAEAPAPPSLTRSRPPPPLLSLYRRPLPQRPQRRPSRRHLPFPGHRAVASSRRSSAGWRQSTTSTSIECPAPARVGESPEKTLWTSLPGARNRRRLRSPRSRCHPPTSPRSRSSLRPRWCRSNPPPRPPRRSRPPPEPPRTVPAPPPAAVPPPAAPAPPPAPKPAPRRPRRRLLRVRRSLQVLRLLRATRSSTSAGCVAASQRTWCRPSTTLLMSGPRSRSTTRGWRGSARPTRSSSKSAKAIR